MTARLSLSIERLAGSGACAVGVLAVLFFAACEAKGSLRLHGSSDAASQPSQPGTGGIPGSRLDGSSDGAGQPSQPGTGGIPGSGGAVGGGGATGGGGALDTGGSTPLAGMTCTTTQDCPSYATCCDGSNESCDGTRLPSGDGANSGEFVVSADELTVTDTITGLVWERDGSGPRAACLNSDPLTCAWGMAQVYCASLTLGGLSGWRLPTVMELSTILDVTVTSGAMIDATAFPNTPAARFWTSSPYAGTSGKWFVYFGNGFTSFDDYLGSNYRVRCVR